MKIKELRSMSKKDLTSQLNELKKEMIKHNAQIATGTTPKSPGQIKDIKKTIAKILTIISEKQKEPKAGVKETKPAKKEAPKKEEK